MFDVERDKRQDEGINKIINNITKGFSRGAAVEYPTGWGKTTFAFKFTKRFNKEKLIHIVVPTAALQLQWIEKTSEIENIVEVFIINTYIKEKRKCGLLIGDEGHRYSNEESNHFNKLLEVCDYEYILILSATYTNAQLEFLNRYNIPLLDRISVQEARAKGWIANCLTYNLGLNFTEEEQQKYIKATNVIKAHAVYIEGTNPFTILQKKNREILKQHCEENNFSIKDISMRVMQHNRYTNVRKALIYGASAKLDVISKIIEITDKQVILFSETKKYATEVSKLISNSVLYHSTISDKKKKGALNKIKSGEARLLCTAKALDEGLDIPNLKVGIVASGTSVERQAKQRDGRIGRVVGNEVAVMINLYIKDTAEIGWLKKRQKNMTNIEWINSIEEIIIQ